MQRQVSLNPSDNRQLALVALSDPAEYQQQIHEIPEFHFDNYFGPLSPSALLVTVALATAATVGRTDNHNSYGKNKS